MATPFRVTLSPEAVLEIVRTAAWWRRNRPAAPQTFQSELDEALALVAERPDIGRRARSRRVGNAHVVTLRRSGYCVFYQVLPLVREVLVVHVRHSKRRPLRRV